MNDAATTKCAYIFLQNNSIRRATQSVCLQKIHLSSFSVCLVSAECVQMLADDRESVLLLREGKIKNCKKLVAVNLRCLVNTYLQIVLNTHTHTLHFLD